MPIRIAQSLAVSFLALHTALAAFNNITDYQANFTFVSSIMSMTDIFDPIHNNWRGTANAFTHHAFLFVIICWEISIALLCGIGALRQLRAIRHEDGRAFQQTKTLSFYGLTLGLGLWLFAFLTIGGEWFLMWQSAHFNAQPTAFHWTTIYLLVFVFLSKEH